MAIKVDLEKAYDRLRWDFIEDTLVDAGIPFSFARIIMECISIVLMQIVWNGSLTEGFKPRRGIRQGCPLSPYLFVPCMERLGHLVHKEVEDNSQRPISITKNGPSSLHLFFANDLFLFMEVDVNQTRMVRKVLDVFGAVSGHKVNANKIEVLFSKNVRPLEKDGICSILRFIETNDLGFFWACHCCIKGLQLARSSLQQEKSGGSWTIGMLKCCPWQGELLWHVWFLWRYPITLCKLSKFLLVFVPRLKELHRILFGEETQEGIGYLLLNGQTTVNLSSTVVLAFGILRSKMNHFCLSWDLIFSLVSKHCGLRSLEPNKR